MPKKKSTRLDNDKQLEHNIEEDIVFEADSLGNSDKLKKIQKKLTACEKERQEYLDGWQRARADTINKDKETVLERARAIIRVETNIFVELFQILDSFDMAFSNKEVWEKVDENWRTGIEQIYAQIIRIFEQAGISVIDTLGVFDPSIHEQVQTQSVTNKKDNGSVLTIIQKGYQRGDIILRPAKVIIGKFK